MKYVCDICGYVYDEAAGDPEHGFGTMLLTIWRELTRLQKGKNS